MTERLIIHQEFKSEYFDNRQEGSVVDTIIIHSMFNPKNVNDQYSITSCKAIMDEYQVSSHYILDREGVVWQVVNEINRAWHAGVSCMPNSKGGCADVNTTSIGIELVALEATDKNHFSIEQYFALALLIFDIKTRHPIQNIYGHKHIAPGRKSDPWGFDWLSFRKEIEEKFGEIGEMKIPNH